MNILKDAGSFAAISKEEIDKLVEHEGNIEENNAPHHHNPEVQKTIRRLSLVWITDSTSKILPKIFQKKHFYTQVIWIIFFVISSTVSFALVIKYVKDYLEYKVDVKVEIVYEWPTKFPAITFCNLNPFYKTRAEKFLNYTYPMVLNTIPNNKTVMSLANTQQELLRASTIINLSPADRKYVGHDIQDMLISCFYNGIPCDEKNFSLTFNYYYGNCYTFNGDTNSKETSVSGIHSGLEVEVLVGNPYNAELFNYKNGLHVAIHNHSVKPLIEIEGTEVPCGKQTNIAIKRTFISKLDWPYNDCINEFNATKSYLNSTLYSRLLYEFNGTTYRQKNCLNLCYQTKIVRDCGCTDPKFTYPAQNETNTIPYVKPCKTNEQQKCLTESIKEYQSDSISEECSTYCKLECNSIYYSHSSSSASYPTRSYAKILSLESKIMKQLSKNASNFELLKYSILKLNVFYEDMSYIRITESPGKLYDAAIYSKFYCDF